MLHVLILSVVAITFKNISCNSIIVEITRRDEVLVGHDPVIEKNVQSELQCVHLCRRYLPCLCKSINILLKNHSQTYQCQILNFTTAKTNSIFISEPNGTHLQLRDKYSPKASCLEWKENGCDVNRVYPILINGATVNVFCDMQIDGGGWTVLQNRFDGSVDFNRIWEDYKNGFGDLNGEFWLGNEIVHQLSKQKSTKKEFWIQGIWFSGETTFRKCRNFSLDSEKEFYRISKLIIVDGFAPRMINGVPYDESSEILDTMKFSTEDSDNDKYPENCAKEFSGGWWYSKCFELNLNGHYFKTVMNNNKGIIWPSARGYSPENMKKTRMMIR